MASPRTHLGLALACSLALAAAAASCGGSVSSVGATAHGGTGGTQSSASGMQSGNAGTGGGISFASGTGASGQGFDVEPKALKKLSVPAGQTKPTVTYEATLNGQPVSVAWGVDLGNVATLPAGPSKSAVFAPTGNAGGLVTITAGLNGMTVKRQVMVELTDTQNGPNGSPAEQAQVPTTVAQLTAGGGVGGVGGEGLGPAVTDKATLGALASPKGGVAGLTFLYPYDKTVFPRGILAPLLMWDWPTGDADAVQLGIKSADGSFSYTGTFGRPAILGAGGKFIRMPIPQDVWAMATSSAGGTTNPLTVSLTVAKGSVGYGPITETWTIAPALLDGIIYYNSYGTQLVQNSGGGAFGTNASFGAAVLSIHVGDTAPKVVAGSNSECRVCHSVAALGSRLVVQWGNGGNDFPRSDYELSANGPATEVTLTDQGAWYPGLYPDGSKMLTADGLLLPLPSDGTPLPVSGLMPDPETPAFSPDGTRVAFNSGAGPQLTVMGFDAATGVFSNALTVVDDTKNAGYIPAWPAFFPDSKSLVFHHQSDPGHDGAGADPCTRGGALAQIDWTDLAGNVTSLDQLYGKGYLPKLPAPSTLACTADGVQVGAGTPYPEMDLDHSDDVDHNYEPTVNPIASGGYAWVVFTSRRMYGSVADIPPFCSDPRGVDLINNITPKKLWVAAVDLTQKAGVDASHPAFYLPAQELLAGNARGFWVLDPCQADGTSCMTGDQCCNGYCEAGDGGALVCSNAPPSSMCSMPGNKCKTAADCCDPTDLCINGFCAQSSPQ